MKKQQGTHKFTADQQAAMDRMTEGRVASADAPSPTGTPVAVTEDIAVKLSDSLLLLRMVPGSRDKSIVITCIETAAWRLSQMLDVFEDDEGRVEASRAAVVD